MDTQGRTKGASMREKDSTKNHAVILRAVGYAGSSTDRGMWRICGGPRCIHGGASVTISGMLASAATHAAMTTTTPEANMRVRNLALLVVAIALAACAVDTPTATKGAPIDARPDATPTDSTTTGTSTATGGSGLFGSGH